MGKQNTLLTALLIIISCLNVEGKSLEEIDDAMRRLASYMRTQQNLIDRIEGHYHRTGHISTIDRNHWEKADRRGKNALLQYNKLRSMRHEVLRKKTREDIKLILKEAVNFDSLKGHDKNYKVNSVNAGILYQKSESKPYSGWIKKMYDSGEPRFLWECKDGKANGRYTAWHKNGTQQGEVNMKDGKLHGSWVEWHKNGQTSFQGHRQNNVPVGSDRLWWENGQLRQEQTYRNGKLISTNLWNNKGKKAIDPEGLKLMKEMMKADLKAMYGNGKPGEYDVEALRRYLNNRR